MDPSFKCRKVKARRYCLKAWIQFPLTFCLAQIPFPHFHPGMEPVGGSQPQRNEENEGRAHISWSRHSALLSVAWSELLCLFPGYLFLISCHLRMMTPLLSPGLIFVAPLGPHKFTHTLEINPCRVCAISPIVHTPLELFWFKCDTCFLLELMK
jgi:hypothetical protein